jgi:hypothetical protein
MARQDEIAKAPLTPAPASSALGAPSDHIDGFAAIVAAPTDEKELIRLKVQQQLLPQAEPQAPPERDQPIRPKAHPSNYPSHVDVRSALQRVTPTGSDTD